MIDCGKLSFQNPGTLVCFILANQVQSAVCLFLRGTGLNADAHFAVTDNRFSSCITFGNQLLRHGVGVFFRTHAGYDNMIRCLYGLNGRSGNCRRCFRLSRNCCSLLTDFYFFYGNGSNRFLAGSTRQGGTGVFRLFTRLLLMDDNRSDSQ